VFVANFSNADYGGYWIGLPVGGEWREVINTNAVRYDGDGGFVNPQPFEAFNGPSNGMPFSAPIEIPKRSMVVLGQRGYDLQPLFYPSPDITDLRIAPRTGESVSLTWQGRAHIEYWLQFSDNLSTWTPMTTLTPSEDGPMEWEADLSNGGGFYRMQVVNGEQGNDSTVYSFLVSRTFRG